MQCKARVERTLACSSVCAALLLCCVRFCSAVFVRCAASRRAARIFASQLPVAHSSLGTACQQQWSCCTAALCFSSTFALRPLGGGGLATGPRPTPAADGRAGRHRSPVVTAADNEGTGNGGSEKIIAVRSRKSEKGNETMRLAREQHRSPRPLHLAGRGTHHVITSPLLAQSINIEIDI